MTQESTEWVQTLALTSEIALMHRSAGKRLLGSTNKMLKAISYSYYIDGGPYFWVNTNINPTITGSVKFHLVVQMVRSSAFPFTVA